MIDPVKCALPAVSYAWHAEVCKSKASFPSKSVAKDWAKRARHEFQSDQKPYLCPVCDRWHLRTKY